MAEKLKLELAFLSGMLALFTEEETKFDAGADCNESCKALVAHLTNAETAAVV